MFWFIIIVLVLSAFISETIAALYFLTIVDAIIAGIMALIFGATFGMVVFVVIFVTACMMVSSETKHQKEMFKNIGDLL